MTRARTLVLLLLVCAVPARAVDVGIGVGGGYFFEGSAQFTLDVRVQQALGRVVSLGVRPGLLADISSTATFGLPIDATVRFHVPHVYFDLLGGLWILFGTPQPLRAHVAGGIGATFGHFSFGVEAGYLMYSAQLLGRFAYTF